MIHIHTKENRMPLSGPDDSMCAPTEAKITFIRASNNRIHFSPEKTSTRKVNLYEGET